MSSTLSVNFSLRQNKGIERSIAFDALRQGLRFIGENPVYVGFGSIWFQDFRIAHRILDIDTMISIEGNEAVLPRAKFNRPYACVEVCGGWSTDVIPKLLERTELASRPWIVWLDYDSDLSIERLRELTGLVETLPARSAMLTTFNARAGRYGRDTAKRREAMADLFGDVVVGDDVPDADMDGAGLMTTLSRCLSAHLEATAIRSGRPGGFVPAIRLHYKDSVEMVTVGGFLPDADDHAECSAMVGGNGWFGFDDVLIESQPLTLREVYALSQLLPAKKRLTKADVRKLGFDLAEDQIRFFERHYQRYPSYAEIV
jgi:hypothetical protein